MTLMRSGGLCMNSEEPKVTHRSTQRVLEVLSTLAESDEGLSMADLSRSLQAPKSSLFPILHTMADENYISYNSDTSRYSLGLRSYLLSSSYKRTDTVLPLLEQAMHGVVDACNETSQLGILDHNRVLYIAKVSSTQPVQLKSYIGKTLGITYTAIGKVLVASLSDENIRNMVAQTIETPTQQAAQTVDQFIEELTEVRSTGFAYDREETIAGVQCIAIPILHHGITTYGLSVTVPSYRLTSEKAELIRAELSRAKRHIEQIIA